MQGMLMTMNSTTAARLCVPPSWHLARSGLLPVFASTGRIESFLAIGRVRGGVGEQRKGSRVSAAGEAV